MLLSFLYFSLYLFLWDWRWHCMLQKEPWCLLQTFFVLLCFLFCFVFLFFFCYCQLFYWCLCWDGDSQVTCKDVTVSAITLFSVFTFFERKVETTESWLKTGKISICFLMVIELGISLLSGIWGVNAIHPSWCLDFLAKQARASWSPDGTRK
jgi:hypothetical protein